MMLLLCMYCLYKCECEEHAHASSHLLQRSKYLLKILHSNIFLGSTTKKLSSWNEHQIYVDYYPCDLFITIHELTLSLSLSNISGNKGLFVVVHILDSMCCVPVCSWAIHSWNCFWADCVERAIWWKFKFCAGLWRIHIHKQTCTHKTRLMFWVEIYRAWNLRGSYTIDRTP